MRSEHTQEMRGFMEENSSISFWKVAVGVLIAAILIGTVFLIARQGKSVANKKLGEISGVLSEYQDEVYAMYNNMEISGAEVRSVIDRACSKEDYVSIRVKTKAGAVVSYNYECNSDMSLLAGSAKNSTYAESLASVASDYINPSAIFVGEIGRDKNGVLVLLSLTQK